jgi:acetylornithine deacetylase/succinyl-diaminopimelate desuccinylase-like protein
MIQANLQTAVGQWVNHHTEDLLQLTEALIRFQSEQHVPIGWEKECQMFVAETLRDLNLELDIFEPTEVPNLTDHPAYWPGRDYSNRPNVVGIWRGSNSAHARSMMMWSPGTRVGSFRRSRRCVRAANFTGAALTI